MIDVDRMEPIDIVMVTWGRDDICRLVIDTLDQNTIYTPYRLIVIDNGSSEEFSQWLNGEVDVYVRLEENKGLEYAKNLGMSLVESDLFISTDNDILVPKPDEENEVDWLGALLDLRERHPEYWSIALRPQILVGTKYEDIFPENVEEIVEFGHVPGYMRLMKTSKVRQAGAWSDKRPLRGHEELWMGQRIKELGGKSGWAAHIPCWHIFGNENWGYPTQMAPEDHGHNPVSSLPKDDWELIQECFIGEYEIQRLTD